MVDMMTLNTMMGRSDGIVRCRNCCQLEAPSTEAASNISRGIDCNPAVYSSVLYPNQRHMTIAEISIRGAVVGRKEVHRRQPEQPQDPIDEAKVLVEDLGEYDCGRCDGGDVRNKQCHAKEVRPAQTRMVEQVREKKRQKQLRDCRDQEYPERVQECIPEPAVCKELLKVPQANEGLLSNGIPVKERDVEGEDEGKSPKTMKIRKKGATYA